MRLRKSPAPLEGVTVKSCLDLLKVLGIFAWRNNTGVARLVGAGGKVRPVFYGYPGSSDILAVVPWRAYEEPPGGEVCTFGRLVCIECKRAGGKGQSADQIEFQRNVERAGGLYLLVHSAAELHEVLKRIGLAD